MFKFRLIGALMLGCALAMSVAPVDAARERKKDEKVSVSKTGRTDKPPQSSQKFVKAYTKAVDQHESDQFDEALASLAKLDTPKASAYEKGKIAQLRGFIAYNQDDLTTAIEQFKIAVGTDALANAEHFQLKLTMAELYHMNDQLPESIAAFNDWLKDADPVTGRNWALQAKNYFDQDDFEQTLVYVDKAFATGEPPDRAWQQMKAQSLLSLERTDEAIAYGREVVAKTPDDAEFVGFLSALLIDAGKPQDAAAELEKLRSAGKFDKESLFVNLAAAYRESDRPLDAAVVLQEGLDKGVVKATRERYQVVGEAYYDAQDPTKAIAAFKSAAALSPTDGNGDFWIGVILLDQEKPQEARAAFAAAIEKGGLRQLGNVYYQLGIAEMDSNNEAAAIAAFQKAQGYPESAKNATQALKSLGR